MIPNNSILLTAQAEDESGTVLAATEGFISKITSNWVTTCLCCLVILIILLAILTFIMIARRRGEEEESSTPRYQRTPKSY